MLDTEVDRLHTLIGRIATDFSSVEGLWYLIFTCLLPGAHRPAVDAIFNRVRGGRQQRELVLSVAESALATQPRLLESVRANVINTNKAADRRNAAIHSIIHVSHYTIPPRIAAMGISKRSKLADKDITAEIADLYRTIVVLEIDVERLRLDAIEGASAVPPAHMPSLRQEFESAKAAALQRLEADAVLRAVEGRP